MIETINQEQKTKGGIYAILNKHTDRVYIGQTICFKQRWKRHQNSLLDGTHRNKFLQNDFNKCFKELGNTDFLEFSVIETVEDIQDKEFLTSREQVFLDIFISEGNCYNIVKKAKIENKSCFTKTPEETKIKRSLALKKVWVNQEYRSLHSRSMKEVYKDLELRKRISDKQASNWNISHNTLRGTLISPNGQEFEIYNIQDFARKNNLSQSHTTSLITKKRKSHKGWTLKK